MPAAQYHTSAVYHKDCLGNSFASTHVAKVMPAICGVPPAVPADPSRRGIPACRAASSIKRKTSHYALGDYLPNTARPDVYKARNASRCIITRWEAACRSEWRGSGMAIARLSLVGEPGCC